MQNILANPRVSVQVDSRHLEARARVIDAAADPDLHAEIQSLSEQKYGWGDGLVVELIPADLTVAR